MSGWTLYNFYNNNNISDIIVTLLHRHTVTEQQTSDWFYLQCRNSSKDAAPVHTVFPPDQRWRPPAASLQTAAPSLPLRRRRSVHKCWPLHFWTALLQNTPFLCSDRAYGCREKEQQCCMRFNLLSFVVFFSPVLKFRLFLKSKF